jgi:hypothetical protein
MPVLRQSRIEREVALLQQSYPGRIDCGFDRTLSYRQLTGFGWVLLHDYRLPAGLGRPSTHVLFLVPPYYPQPPPHGLFVDRRLHIPSHFIRETSDLNPLGDEHWAWLCAHVDPGGWRPSIDVVSGDNLRSLLTFYAAIFTAMKG